MTAEEIRQAAGVLFEPGQVVEVRAIVDGGGPWNGYFDNFDTLAEKIDALAADPKFTAIYWSLNVVNPALIARRENTISRAVSGAGEADITRRRWLLVDADPERPSGISSAEAEKAAAFARAESIAAWLDEQGWPEPVKADSGNGAHLLYRVDLPNDPDITNLVHGCLVALSARFTDDAVKVDTGVADAPRIIRVYGTPNRKGADRPDRPHRRATLAKVPDVIEAVPIERLRALAAEAVETTTATTAPKAGAASAGPVAAGIGLDLRAWLDEHAGKLAEKGIAVREKAAVGHLYFGEFERCPFSNGAHDDGARIGQWSNGAIYATCKHNSCQDATAKGKGWQTIRALVEPPKPKKAKATKGDGGEPSKRVLPHFEKDGRLYLDVRDECGHHWFTHLDDAGELAFSREVIGADGIAILPRELPIHQDTGMAAAIVGLPSKEAMEAATVMDARHLFEAIDRHLYKYMDMPKDDRPLFIYYQFYT